MYVHVYITCMSENEAKHVMKIVGIYFNQADETCVGFVYYESIAECFLKYACDVMMPHSSIVLIKGSTRGIICSMILNTAFNFLLVLQKMWMNVRAIPVTTELSVSTS